jgi:hypothetical protein
MSTPTGAIPIRCPSHTTFARRLESHESRIATAEARIDGQDSRVEALESGQAEIRQEMRSGFADLGLKIEHSVTGELSALRKAFEAQAMADAQRKVDEEAKVRTDFRRKVLVVVIPMIVSAFVGAAGQRASSQCSHAATPSVSR